MKILFLTEDEDGASTRYRVTQFLPALEERGVRFECACVPADRSERRALFLRAAEFDRVVLQRRLIHPFDFRVLRRAAREIVYDVDDAVQIPDSMSGKRRSWARWLKFLYLTSRADRLVVGNRFLAAMASEFSRRITVLPTVVDVSRYPLRADASGPASAKEATVLVWIGSRATLPYLQDVLPSLDLLARDLPLRLLVIADAKPPRGRNLDIEHVPWSASTEAADLARAHIGLAPLRDDRWCRGKCGLRLLQYFACGIPAVASPVGVQGDWSSDGCAVPARAPQDFASAVARLARDADLRARVSRTARRRVVETLSLASLAPVWATVMSGPLDEAPCDPVGVVPCDPIGSRSRGGVA